VELHEIYGTGNPPGKRVTSTIQTTNGNLMLFCILTQVTRNDSSKPNTPNQTQSGFIDPTLALEDWLVETMADPQRTESDSDNEVPKDCDNTDLGKTSRKRPQSPNTRDSTLGSKSKCPSVYQSAAKLAKEGMQELGECMKAAMIRAPELPTITRFDQCLPLLSQMRETMELDKTNYLKYSRLLRNDDKLAAMFVGMDDDLRLEWLEEEIAFAQL